MQCRTVTSFAFETLACGFDIHVFIFYLWQVTGPADQHLPMSAVVLPAPALLQPEMTAVGLPSSCRVPDQQVKY